MSNDSSYNPNNLPVNNRPLVNDNPIDIELTSSFQLNWGRKHSGFGQIYFEVQGNKILCHNECMGREFIKKALCALVDQSEMCEPYTEDQRNPVRVIS